MIEDLHKDQQKSRVAIVAGELTNPRMLHFFEPLLDRFEVMVFAMSDKGLADNHWTGLKLKLFDHVDDMPGYMQGLEDELADFDVIVGLENSRLSSFQGLRAARRFQIPYLLVTSEHHAFFYEKYPNIRAVQHDINNKAAGFVALSELARQALELEQVPSEAIEVIAPVVNGENFDFDPFKREKFRKYLNLPLGCKLVLLRGEITAQARWDDVFRALKRLEGEKDLSDVRIIVAGSGPYCQELKYCAFDLGFGSRTMFLQQDPDPFLIDLYSASDILIQRKPLVGEIHEPFALSVLESAGCGVIPIVVQGTREAESLGIVGEILEDDSYQALSRGISDALDQAVSIANRQRIRSALLQFQNSRQSGARIIAMVERIILQGKQERRAVFDIISFEKRVFELIGSQKGRDALIEIEEVLLNPGLAISDRAMLHCLKGEALYSFGKFEEAMHAYSESLRVDSRFYRSYRGLGYISWQGHSHQEALTFFRKALAIKEDDPETILGLALVYRRLNLSDEALFWLEKCLGLTNPPKAAELALTQACLEHGDSSKAIAVLERLIENRGESSSTLVTLAQLHLREGRAEIGNQILQRALSA